MKPSVTAVVRKDEPSVSAFSWLLNSGIQDKSVHSETTGGVNAWLDLKNQSYPFVYAEITGYAVNAFLFYYSVTGQSSYLDAAIRAGDWLLNAQYSETGLIKTRINQRDYQKPYFDSWVFTFDQWVIIYGLVNLAEVSGKSVYLEHAERVAKLLMKSTVRPDGFFCPIFDVEKNKALTPGDKWSRQSGSFHAKALMPLQKLYEVTSNEEYRNCALKLIRKTISIQQKDGRFITQDSEGSTHLHPHIYSLEGLLSFGLLEGNPECLQSAENGIKWVLDRQLEEGSIYSFFVDGKFLPYVRADILAQALRVGVILVQHGILKGYEENLRRLREKLLFYQMTAGSENGGFLYGQEQDGTIHYHLNAWVTMFAAQALWIYDHFEPGDEPFRMAFFV